jgi:hypothetical protein
MIRQFFCFHFVIRFTIAKAGAPGFEPRSTDPKSGVLPLHHAPVKNASPAERFYPIKVIMASESMKTEMSL